MNILGIDLSLSGTGLAILTFDELFHEPELPKRYLRVTNPNVELLPTEWHFGYLVTPSTKLQLERWEEILNAVKLSAENVHQVVIEGYSFGSKFSSSMHAIHELGGIVRFHLAKMGHTPLSVPPSVLKKFITGAGNADKNQVLKEIYKRYHVDLPDDNMADAFGLAKFGQAMVSTEGLPQFQVEIIESFKKPKEKPVKRGRVA